MLRSVLERSVDEIANVLVGESIVDVLAVAPPLDDALRIQYA